MSDTLWLVGGNSGCGGGGGGGDCGCGRGGVGDLNVV